jgi:hypothetical protein
MTQLVRHLHQVDGYLFVLRFLSSKIADHHVMTIILLNVALRTNNLYGLPFTIMMTTHARTVQISEFSPLSDYKIRI